MASVVLFCGAPFSLFEGLYVVVPDFLWFYCVAQYILVVSVVVLCCSVYFSGLCGCIVLFSIF